MLCCDTVTVTGFHCYPCPITMIKCTLHCCSCTRIPAHQRIDPAPSSCCVSFIKNIFYSSAHISLDTTFARPHTHTHTIQPFNRKVKVPLVSWVWFQNVAMELPLSQRSITFNSLVIGQPTLQVRLACVSYLLRCRFYDFCLALDFPCHFLANKGTSGGEQADIGNGWLNFCLQLRLVKLLCDAFLLELHVLQQLTTVLNICLPFDGCIWVITHINTTVF